MRLASSLSIALSMTYATSVMGQEAPLFQTIPIKSVEDHFAADPSLARMGTELTRDDVVELFEEYQLLTTPGLAIVVPQRGDEEPVLLIVQDSDRLVAWWGCRFIPICMESPQ
ncbi:MAG: hypothetical protein OXM59_10920 [Gammaproteobacteria bacterium]|nr:hypothetical protein [Gammaproteobacteria bacterium]